jgi:hypothetical protein
LLTIIELTPIARAILFSNSEHDLDRAIADDPGAVTERIYGFTTLELCSTWPEGLQRLLQTTARELIDVETITERMGPYASWKHNAPIFRALRTKSAEAVDVLMKAGCALTSGPELEVSMLYTSAQCVKVVASHLAERRRQLLRLCQRELGIHLDWDPINVPDEKAGALCAALARSGIPVPRHLSVPPDYVTVFHLSGLQIRHWGVFGDIEFRGLRCRDPMGLTPIVIWRPYTFRHRYGGSGTPEEEEELLRVWRWVQDARLLDQRQEDPLSLGLNTSATGWHYMAATLGFTYLKPHFAVVGHPFPYHMINDLAKNLTQDGCVCWCSPHGEGCSTLKSLWIARADWTNVYLSHGQQPEHDMLWRHCLLHHHLQTGHLDQTAGDSIRTMSLQLVRLLTFEILDMTHTCCYLEQLENLRGGQVLGSAQRKAPSIRNDWDDLPEPRVLANCCPRLAAEIQSDSLEQQNAQLLDALMQEFEPQILSLDFADPRTLEGFVWGPWRRRISDLFAVNSRVVAEMEQLVDSVFVTCKFINSLISY